MSTPSSLFAHYQMLFEANGYEIREEAPYFGKRPLKLAGLPVLLPSTAAMMKSQDDCIIFHPIGESLIHTDSPTLQMVNRIINKSANQAFHMLLEEFSAVLSNKDAKINKHQRQFLEGLGDWKDASNLLKKLLERADDKVISKRLLTITVDADETLGELRYKRVARVTSPLLSFLETWDKSQTIWGVKVGVKRDVEMIARLIRNLLPGIESPLTYSIGSNNRVSPNYIAQVTAFCNLMTKMREVCKKTISIKTEEMLAKDYTFIDDLEERIAVLEAGAPRDLRGNYGDVSIPVASKTISAAAMTTDTTAKATVKAKAKEEAKEDGLTADTTPVMDKSTTKDEPVTADNLFSDANVDDKDLPSWVFGIDNEEEDILPGKKASKDDDEVSDLWTIKPDTSKYDDLPAAFRPSSDMLSGERRRSSGNNDNSSIPSWA